MPTKFWRLNDLAKQAIAHFGLTDNVKEAGYVLRDGKLLDFTGRHYSDDYKWDANRDRFVTKGRNGDYRDWLRGTRNVDHRELDDLVSSVGYGSSGNGRMLDFQTKAKAIRIDAGSGMASATFTDWSNEQIKTVVEMAKYYTNGDLTVEIDSPQTGRLIGTQDIQRVTVNKVVTFLRNITNKQQQEEKVSPMRSFTQFLLENYNDARGLYIKINRVGYKGNEAVFFEDITRNEHFNLKPYLMSFKTPFIKLANDASVNPDGSKLSSFYSKEGIRFVVIFSLDGKQRYIYVWNQRVFHGFMLQQIDKVKAEKELPNLSYSRIYMSLYDNEVVNDYYIFPGTFLFSTNEIESNVPMHVLNALNYEVTYKGSKPFWDRIGLSEREWRGLKTYQD